jgi:hypothetical protein
VGGRYGRWLKGKWPSLLILALSAAILALVVFDSPARAVPVLTYVAVVPGLAWIRLTRVADLLTVTLLGVGLSLALGIVVAQAMVTLHEWSPLRGLSALVVLASLAAIIELWRGPSGTRRRPGGRGS